MKFLLLFLFPISIFAQNSGQASYYGNECSGKLMANNHPFDPNQYTCASWFYPLNTLLKVTNLENNKSVIVVVTDRGPAKRLVEKGRVIDLSEASFAKIGKLGLINVTIEKVD